MVTATSIEAGAAGRVLGPGRYGVIAGSGTLPLDVARKLREKGHDPVVLLIKGEARPADFGEFDFRELRLGDFAGILAALKRSGVTRVVLAGGVAARPRLRELRPGLHVLRLAPYVVAARLWGDDAILSGAVRYLESIGLMIVGAHELLPELLVPSGALTRARPTRGDRHDIAIAMKAARAIGALDIGQAAVAVSGRVIALEGIEGTDALLERSADLRDHGRLAGATRGVLAKCSKPQQELRADLPSIGPATVRRAHAAGLAGIAVEAGRSLILEAAETVAEADSLKMFIVGVEGADTE